MVTQNFTAEIAILVLEEGFYRKKAAFLPQYEFDDFEILGGNDWLLSGIYFERCALASTGHKP